MATLFGLLVSALFFLFWGAVFLAGAIIVAAVIGGIIYLIVLGLQWLDS